MNEQLPDKTIILIILSTILLIFVLIFSIRPNNQGDLPSEIQWKDSTTINYTSQ